MTVEVTSKVQEPITTSIEPIEVKKYKKFEGYYSYIKVENLGKDKTNLIARDGLCLGIPQRFIIDHKGNARFHSFEIKGHCNVFVVGEEKK